MKALKFLKNAAGISMIEVMMAVSVVGGLSLTVAQLMKNTSESTKQNEAKQENVSLKGLIQNNLSVPQACKNTFGALITQANLTAMTGTGTVAVPNIRNKVALGTIVYSSATNLKPLTITTMVLTNYVAAAGTADLVVNSTFSKSPNQIVMVKPIKIPINLNIDNTNPASPSLVSCSSMAISGGEWMLGGNAGTVDGTDYLGTSDNQPLNFRVNNQNAGRIDTTPSTFFGYQAGRVTTSGFDNTGVGYKALEQSSGRYSVAFGDNALALNGTGQYNTALGSRALSNSANASHNTAVGAQALRYLTSGSSNVALGSNAMFSNTTGAQNVALGVMTLRANIGGGNNTGIGTNALYVNTSGGSNTALGVSALGSNVGGSYNVALGSNSGSFNTNGQYNTYVGHVAGNNLTTGSNNIFLGYAAGTGVANASNKLYIESTTNTTPLIGAEFSARTVRLSGTTTINVPAYTTGIRIPNRSGINSVNSVASDVMYIDNRVLFRDAASGGTGFIGIAGGLGVGGGSYWDGSVIPAQGNVHIQGNVGIGNQAPAYKLHVSGSVYAGGDVTMPSGSILRVSPWNDSCVSGLTCNARFHDIAVGTIVRNAENTWSDKRLKKDIKPLSDKHVQQILKLEPVQYFWKKKNSGVQYGFIAQEVEKIMPEIVVNGTDKMKTKAITTSSLYAPIVKAIQAIYAKVLSLFASDEKQNLEIKKLKNENIELKAEMLSLRADLEKLKVQKKSK